MCEVKRGDIVFVELTTSEGSVQSGKRPCLVVSNNANNTYSQVLQVVTLSTRLDKKKLPTHKILNKGVGGLKTSSVALCETLTSISKSLVKFKIGSLPDDVMCEINQGVMVQLGIA